MLRISLFKDKNSYFGIVMGEKKKNGENIDIKSFKDDFLKEGNKPYKGFKKKKVSKSMNNASSKEQINSKQIENKNKDNFDEIDENLKKEEIQRLTKFDKNSEVPEPRKGILNDDEILKYAGDSKAASEIRLKRGIGSLKDKKLINGESLDWIVLILAIGIMSILPVCFVVSYNEHNPAYIILGLFVIGILICYICYVLFLKDYTDPTYIKELSHNGNIFSENENFEMNEYMDNSSFESYAETIEDLERLYKVKEKLAIDLIEKRFSSESMTYDRFISTIRGSRYAFYNTLESIFSIIEIKPEDNLTIRKELETKISILKAIVGKVDELTNELVINLTQSEVDGDVKNLLEDMELLIDSVKDYK